MRITDHMIFKQSVRDISRQRDSMFTLQAQAATGKKIQSIDEDPVAAERVRLLREARQATYHYEKNITRSKTQLDAADTALGEAANIAIRAKEIAMAMGTETVSPEQRQIVAAEVQGLYDSMINVANTQAAGEYIFGGFQTNTQPFLTTGAYVGDNGVKNVEVGPDTKLAVNVSGNDAFIGGAGGVDVFAELDALRVALETDDDVGIQNAIDTMEQALNQMTAIRTDAGLKLNQLDVASAVRDGIEDSLVKEESSVIDIDPVDVFLQLNETSKALENALAVSQKVTSSTLLTSL